MGIVVVLDGVLAAAVLRMAGMVGAAHARSSTLRRLRRGGERDKNEGGNTRLVYYLGQREAQNLHKVWDT